jgi:hypothetical protein
VNPRFLVIGAICLGGGVRARRDHCGHSAAPGLNAGYTESRLSDWRDGFFRADLGTGGLPPQLADETGIFIMTIHPHTDVPQLPARSKRLVMAPVSLLALSAFIVVGYVAFMHTPSASPTSAPLTTTGQGGRVAIAPIVEVTIQN